MSTLDVVETAFATYLRDVLPARVMVRGRVGEAAAPATAATLWDVATVTASDNPVTTYEDDDQIVTSTDTVVSFLVTLIGGSAMADAVRVCNGMRASQRTGDLYAVCGLWGVDPAQDLTALETGTMRTRAEFRVALSAAIETVFIRETIDAEQVTIDTPAPGSITFTIEAP